MQQLTATFAILLTLILATTMPVAGADYLFVGSSTGELWRARTDGTGLVRIHDQSYIRGVAADLAAGHLYHTLAFDEAPGRIVRTLLDGSEPTVIVSGLDYPGDIELDDLAGKLYWTEQTAGTVARANLDGSSVEDVLTGLNGPGGLALDLEAGQLYVSLNQSNSIVRAGLDGSSPGTFLSYVYPQDLEVDSLNDKLYIGSNGSTPGLSWVGLDGTGLTTLVSSAVLSSIKVRGSSLYYTNNGNLIRRDLDGGNPTSLLPASSVTSHGAFDLDLGSGHVFAMDGLSQFLYRFDIDPVVTNPLFIAATVGSLLHDVAVDPATGSVYIAADSRYAVLATDRDAIFFDLVVSDPSISASPRGIAIDPATGRLVWGSDSNRRLLQAVNADGSGLVELATGLESPHDVAVDPAAGRVYFTDGAASGSGTTGVIRWVPIAGGTPTDVLTGLSEGVRGLDLDQAAGKMYWTDHVADTISRANLDGSGVEVVLSGLDNPHDVAVDSAAGRIYWTEGIRGSAGSTGTVRSANLDGTDPQDVLTGLSSFIRDLTLVGLPAPDDDVRVDFATAGTDPGGNWNTTDGISPIDLVDHATGLATGIQVSVVNAVSQYSGDNEWTAGDKDWMVAAAGRDELFLVGGGQATVVFSDLLGLSYQVEMVSSSSVASDIADITIDGAFADRTFEGRTDSLGDDWNAMTDGRDPGDWLIWDSVTPTNGEITVLFDLTQTGGGAVINAARLRAATRIFADGFESGDMRAWSGSTP